MFFKKKKKEVLGRAQVCTCTKGHKRVSMQMIKQEYEGSGNCTGPRHLWGKEEWQCPKCKEKQYIQYDIYITNTYC